MKAQITRAHININVIFAFIGKLVKKKLLNKLAWSKGSLRKHSSRQTVSGIFVDLYLDLTITSFQYILEISLNQRAAFSHP